MVIRETKQQKGGVKKNKEERLKKQGQMNALCKKMEVREQGSDGVSVCDHPDWPALLLRLARKQIYIDCRPRG